MSIDHKSAMDVMLDAVKTIIGADFPRLRVGARQMLNAAWPWLDELAQARLDGELDDDMLVVQLANEEASLVDALMADRMMSRPQAQAVAKAVISAFRQMLSDALHASAVAAKGTARAAAGKRSGPGKLQGEAAGKVQGKVTATTKNTAARAHAFASRKLNARPDTLDFRDLMYVPTLVEVGSARPLEDYLKAKIPILDQGQEGACTGYGLATVAHYLLRTRRVVPDKADISPWMFYVLARRYDEYPGETYEGSSCRGAIKGWHKHGVCAANLWRHSAQTPDHSLSEERIRDAQNRPLGAYVRVNHKDLVAMHAAISEVGILYASANVHTGWSKVQADGIIPLETTIKGAHAFAIVAYDRDGFWIQNSWGAAWGFKGFCKISYADWLQNGTDVWVTRLGVPIELAARKAVTGRAFTASAQAKAYAFDDIRPHVISIGNDGQLRSTGNIATPPQQVKKMLHEDFPRITKGWKKRRIVLYAHGGLVSEDASVQRVAEYRRAMLDKECYPLAFIWHSDYWTTLSDMLKDALQFRRPEGMLDKAKDFMLDRLDDALEPIARKLTGKAAWDEMKENAALATISPSGGARFVLRELAALLVRDPTIEIHLIGHSAGGIFHAPLLQLLSTRGDIANGPLRGEAGLGVKVTSCTLWAPACTMAQFDDVYAPAIASAQIERFALYTLSDRAEQDDHCAAIYHKSLLYLVSNAFEERPRIPVFRPEGIPILGMAKFIAAHAGMQKLISAGRVDWVQAPNQHPPGDDSASTASHHGDFDDDVATVSSTLARILNAPKAAVAAQQAFRFSPGAASTRNMRSRLDRIVR